MSQPDDKLQQLQQAHGQLRQAWKEKGGLSYPERMELLGKALSWIRQHRQDIVLSVQQDYGHRSSHETLMAEVFAVVDELRHARAHLAEWMEEQPRPVALTFQPGSARVVWQPLGVVGIISPWNYPFQLAISPALAAISAGCRVLVKPSELTPATAALLQRMAGEVFPPEVLRVVEGEAEVAQALCRLPLDHLLFTGSTAVGRKVMAAAAENLTPVTLELGGKSPVLVHPDFPTERAAERIVYGKLFNAGQTCIAPDTLLVEKGQVDAFVAAIQAAVARSYPRLQDNPDYTAIINERHYNRLVAWIEDARAKGATVIACNPANESLDPARRKLPLHLVLGGTEEMTVMQEEIFGPILPIVPVATLDEGIEWINARPRPLALYYFDWDRGRGEQVVARTRSGGVTLNDTLLHFAQLELPFGGVGASGMGAYHGWYGFRTFSHERGIFAQARLNGGKLIQAPYTARTDRLIKVMVG